MILEAKKRSWKSVGYRSMDGTDEVWLHSLFVKYNHKFVNGMDPECTKWFVQNRLYYEKILREEFIRKGGQVVRKALHYMVVEHSPWLSSWYDNMAYIKIPIEEFNIHTLSFTYGDSHPTFSSRVNDGKEYRKKLYTFEEILDIIAKYGLPQDWNDDGKFGPERYIEVHIWSDETINNYIC